MSAFVTASHLLGPYLLALLVSLLATMLCERVAGRIGLVARPRDDRWHRGDVPMLGGVAMMAAMIVVAAPMARDIVRFAPLIALAVAMGLVGLVDDVRVLRPQTKLAAQIVIAATLIQLGTVLSLTPYALLNVFITLLWVVGITNAFNLLDNMDGLAAGVAILAALFRLAVFVIDGNSDGARMMALFLGAVSGFFIRNFPPARVFMGDAGSLFLGFFMGGVSLVSDYSYTRGVAGVLVVPVLLVLVPILDTAFVTVARLVSGRSVTQGGRDHTSHRLVALGISERQTLGLLLGISAISGVLAILSYQQGFEHSIILLALLAIGLTLLGIHLSRAHVVTSHTRGAEIAVIRLVQDFPYKRHAVTLAIDVVLIVLAYYAAYLLRFEDAFESERARFLGSVGPVVALQVATLAISRTYGGLWRYTSLYDLLRLVRAATLGVGATVLYLTFTTRLHGFSRSVFVLDWALLVLLLTGSRAAYRLLGEWLRPRSVTPRRALIYGAGDGGALTVRELRNNADLGRRAVGFLDDDRDKRGTRMFGLPVLGGLEVAEHALTTLAVEEVIVASQKIPAARVRRLEAICHACGVVVTHASLGID
jgi:UDP-GlcNAc:undecaprenyl-phosphate/decaprenyl-phosphate GlcNAc-1-phosphate transferase